MLHLYVLINVAPKARHYIGITDNLAARLAAHNSGRVRSTKPYRPWRMVYTEEYASRTEARRRELFLKRTARARKDIFDSISNIGPIV